MVKNVHRDTALVTCLKEQRPTGEAGHVPPCEGRRGRVGHIKLPSGCKVTARAGRLLREEDTGKLGAATRCNRDSQAGRYRLRGKNEDSAEPQCECAPPASTPRKPKKPARSRVCIARQTGCNIRLQLCGARSPAQASRSPAVCYRRGTSPVTWSSASASGRRADSADRRASVDGFPPMGGAPSTSASSEFSAMRASVDGFPPLGGAPSTSASRSCSAIATFWGAGQQACGRSSWSSDWIKAGIA